MNVRLTVWRKDGRVQSAVKDIDSAMQSFDIAQRESTTNHVLMEPASITTAPEWR
jgi:hypothetical protein